MHTHTQTQYFILKIILLSYSCSGKSLGFCDQHSITIKPRFRADWTPTSLPSSLGGDNRQETYNVHSEKTAKWEGWGREGREGREDTGTNGIQSWFSLSGLGLNLLSSLYYLFPQRPEDSETEKVEQPSPPAKRPSAPQGPGSCSVVTRALAVSQHFPPPAGLWEHSPGPIQGISR